MRPLRRRRGEAGFTLVETLVALMVFSVVTVGLTPLVLSSMKAAALSRSYTVGRHLASEAMERVRGLPFFESTKGVATPPRRDFLDLYFPDAVASAAPTGYQSAASTYVTKCSATSELPAGSGPLACPPSLADGTSALPPGYELTFEATFVKPGSGTPQTFTTVPPASTYVWNPAATQLSREIPPSQLVKLSIVATWTRGGSRTFRLTSIIGPRKVTEDKLRGNARVDYNLQATTSYTDASGDVTTLAATIGHSTAAADIRSVAAADADVATAEMTLTREETATTPAETLPGVSGASVILHAPPNVYPSSDVVVGAQSLTNTDLVPSKVVSHVAGTQVDDPGVQVVSELPKATGPFSLSTASGDVFWVDTELGPLSQTQLRLDANGHAVSAQKNGSYKVGGSTSAETFPLATRSLKTIATSEIGRLLFLPTTFISGSDKQVLILENFRVTATCDSTGNAATAVRTLTWSATLKYWRDSANDGSTSGSYHSVAINQTNVGTELANLLAANPRVYDDANDANDVFLFETGSVKGYFEEIAAATPATTMDATGQSTSASIGGALRFVTSPTDPADEATKLSVSVGKVSCEAVDKRV